MKEWKVPALETVDINETAEQWRGSEWDGGYIGDGHISGHLKYPDTNKTSGQE